MKATDLMLGDWVLCDGKPYQVAEISAGLLCIDAERELFANPEDLEPIPLTPEILEKNGWLATHYSYGNINEDKDKKGVAYALLEDGGLKVATVDFREEEIEVELFNQMGHLTSECITAIHQLQHALRLCGIEKEIVL
jgi:hypothetical protein